jgi:hypothetical protein
MFILFVDQLCIVTYKFGSYVFIDVTLSLAYSLCVWTVPDLNRTDLHEELEKEIRTPVKFTVHFRLQTGIMQHALTFVLVSFVLKNEINTNVIIL